MNCIHHPNVPVAAYCQNCGKPLCQECVRSIGGVVYCEECLAVKLNAQAAAAPAGTVIPPYVGLPPMDGPKPGLALGLGFIPGVGAMYNGQFVKGVVHVVIFALLCSLSSHEDFFGILIPFWIAYQVFDAFQTAKARRDGLPLPNPFGLNDLAYRLGLQSHPEGAHPHAAPFAPPAGVPYTAAQTQYAPVDPVVGASAGTGAHPGFGPNVGAGYDPFAPPMSGFVPPSGAAPVSGVPGTPYVPPQGTFGANGVPVGAIVLIGLGTLFLLSSLGVFRDEWLGRMWPLVIVGAGVFLLVRRTREMQGRQGQGGPRP